MEEIEKCRWCMQLSDCDAYMPRVHASEIMNRLARVRECTLRGAIDFLQVSRTVPFIPCTQYGVTIVYTGMVEE